MTKPTQELLTFSFPGFCISMQKISLFHLFIFEIQSISEYHDHTCHNHFLTMPTPKIFKHILICMNLYQHAKNQLIPSVHFSNKVNFRVQRPNSQHPFLTIPNQKMFIQLLSFANLHQHTKNEAVSLIYFGEIPI